MRTPSFFWYDLMTTDIGAAREFYADVVGWRPESLESTDLSGRPYIVLNAGNRGVGGIMNLPRDAAKMGMPPAWIGYIYSADADASVEALKKAGGQVHRAPEDIPDVGRFAVVADPQGATFMFLHPNGPDMPPVPLGTPGHVGWHELFTTDWQEAFDFYAGQLGWTKGEPFDMGPMGTYQLFAAGGGDIGGMMNKPEQIPVPVWQFYFNVPGIDAAAKKVTDGAGKILMGPMQVPGGGWIVQCQDPQGAHFALSAPTR